MIKLNNKQIKFGKFPNGESILDYTLLTPHLKPFNYVEWIYEGDEEFFKLALVKEYLDTTNTLSGLQVLYMPHSRMDNLNDNYVTSLRVSAKLINSLEFKFVWVSDPHSEETEKRVNNFEENKWLLNHLERVIKENKPNTIFFPNYGAYERYKNLCIEGINFACGIKKRDQFTGEILEYSIKGDVGERVLIIDDCCSKGGTFSHAYSELLVAGADDVSLMVNYLESNVFYGDLFYEMEYIYCNKDNIFTEMINKQIVLV